MQRYYKNCTYANKANIIFKKDRLIYQNHRLLRFCGSSSVGGYFPQITLIYTDIPRFRANLCSSVGGYISLPCGQKSKLSKPSVSGVVEIVEISASVASKEVKFLRVGANPCSSVGGYFPHITLIYTDIPRFRANLCSSVVGIISR